MLIATLGGKIVVDESSHIKACFQLHKDLRQRSLAHNP